jgi:hypothetical protein
MPSCFKRGGGVPCKSPVEASLLVATLNPVIGRWPGEPASTPASQAAATFRRCDPNTPRTNAGRKKAFRLNPFDLTKVPDHRKRRFASNNPCR